jgi:hypothetical protein
MYPAIALTKYVSCNSSDRDNFCHYFFLKKKIQFYISEIAENAAHQPCVSKILLHEHAPQHLLQGQRPRICMHRQQIVSKSILQDNTQIYFS